ncbi:MAG: aminoacyl-tRNA hydrolase [Rhodospirillaceae bacterium]|nr:aminoacyl-tRNA hydrolase [Rhodospirillaceae bacterium]
MDDSLELVVGLGNPGLEHRRARHNAGFWFVDLLARRYGGEFRARRRLYGDTAEITVQGRRIRLLKPMTYMNDSGRAVAAAIAYYKTPTERTLVVYDELDLVPGRAKLRFNGGPGGHNGVRNVAECVGRDFWRLRLGIGHPGPGRKDRVIGYVLRRPPADEHGAILDTVLAAADALEVFVEKGAERAKTQLHSRPLEDTAAGDADPEGAG